MWKITDLHINLNVDRIFRYIFDHDGIFLFDNNKDGFNVVGLNVRDIYDTPAKTGNALSALPPYVPLLGYVSFDYKDKLEEKGLFLGLSHDWFPQFGFYLFDTYLFFRNGSQSVLVVSQENSSEQIVDLLRYSEGFDIKEKKSYYGGTSHNRSEFVAAVKKAVDYIRQGDIYQVNLTRAIYGTTEYEAWELASAIYKSNPISHGVFAKIGDGFVISSSPEHFFSVKNGTITTSPIKGTAEATEQGLMQLLGSEKEKAELAMIVDLLRNDLNAICEPGTVVVDKFREIIKLRNVYHTYADISGKLAKGMSFGKIVKAMFPGGSISGCPKIRACQIIEELEGQGRGIYTGSFGYVYPDMNMSFNIMIRSVFVKNENFIFNVGGGITMLSCPEAEFCETVHKARNLWQALNLPEIEDEKC